MEELLYNSDHVLVEEIQQSNPRAKRYLIHRYQEQITWLIKKKTGYNNPYQEDLVNETIMAVLESIQAGNYDPDKGKELGSYIYGITMHKIGDYYKYKEKLKRTEPIDDDFLNVIEEKNEEVQQQEKGQVDIIRVLIKKLHPKYQQVLHLRYNEELSMKEIGNKIGKTEQQIINLHDYAIRKIRNACKKKKYYSIFLLFFLIITIGVLYHKYSWTKIEWIAS